MTDVIPCTSLADCLCVLQFDLVSTIGEAAALGAAGVVSWGDMNVTATEVENGGSSVFFGQGLELKLTIN